MDLLEKQQKVDSVRGIVKARWFLILILVLCGLVLRIKFFGWSLSSNPLIFLFGVVAVFYNLLYWFFIRRPIAKIGDRSLGVITTLQVIGDQVVFACLFYAAGTTESIVYILFFISLLVASSLFQLRGLIISGFLSIFLYSGILLAEYYKVLPHMQGFQGVVWAKNIYVVRNVIVSLALYTIATIIFAAFLSDLIRKRERGLREQHDKVVEQSQSLVKQTKELLQTKNFLNDALVKSDRMRLELSGAKEDLAETNKTLKERIKELESFNDITVGRELKMSELKERVKELEKKIQDLEGGSASLSKT